MLKLNEMRTKAGISRGDLAERVGVDEETIGRYERGEREPRISTLQLIARTLGCSIADLLGDPPAPRQRRRSRDGGAKAA